MLMCRHSIDKFTLKYICMKNNNNHKMVPSNNIWVAGPSALCIAP